MTYTVTLPSGAVWTPNLPNILRKKNASAVAAASRFAGAMCWNWWGLMKMANVSKSPWMMTMTMMNMKRKS